MREAQEEGIRALQANKNRDDREGPNVAGTATLTHDRPKIQLYELTKGL